SSGSTAKNGETLSAIGPRTMVERLRRTKRKKIPREGREGAWCPIAPNQRWSLDFTSDALANRRKFRTANLRDDCTRE
ncbi:hypothetical protein ACROSR_14305, partial [Roseovarius tibetensis]